MNSSTTLTSYDFVAGFYDTASNAWSLGQIRACKNAQLKFLRAGEVVLFVGCGGGTDVVEAARHGCLVTAIDNSQKMLDKLQHRLSRHSASATLICDRFENLDAGQYETVCVNFFLNCFPHEAMTDLLRQAVARVQEGGKLMIADVAPPSGNFVARVANTTYLQGGMLPFWITGMVRWHPNHDYISLLKELGWVIEAVQPFRMLKLGPVTFRNIVARRPEDAG